jgi:hypothetical protein
MKRSQKRRSEPAPKKVVMSLRDKIMAFGIPIAIFAAITFVYVSGTVEKHSMALDRTLSKWQSLYHLDESQIAEIKRLEIEFHGTGNPLAISKEHSPAEIHEHHVTISKVMKPEDGSRFLEAMEGRKGAH